MGRERLRSGKAHGGVVVMMVLLQRRKVAVLGSPHLFQLPPFGGSHDLAGAGLVGWVVKESTDVVHKQGIEQLRDLLLVRKI
jgi:hypothetical protein